MIKKNLLISLLGCVVLWQSCIKDESVGIVYQLSEIEIQTTQDTFYVDFGSEIHIPVTVTQTGDLPLSYQWRAGWINPVTEEIADSLKIISGESEFRYTFTELGTFRVRLEIRNDDGSSYHFFTIYVRSPYQQGLLVLSEDANGQGRSSFLRVKEAGEVVTGTEKFITSAFEGLNRDIPLNHIKDLTWIGKFIYLLAEDGQKIHIYDKQTFYYISSIQVDQNFAGLRLKKFCLGNPPSGFSTVLAWTDQGETRIIDSDMQLILPDEQVFPGETFGKLYIQSSLSNILFVNFEESYITHALGFMFPSPRYSSEDYFAGKHILNLVADAENRLHVITTVPNDDRMVTITVFSDMTTSLGFLIYTGAFLNPQNYTYKADKPLTLTRESEMLVNNKYHECFYYQGKELYLWIYRGESPQLPNLPLDIQLDGEITCMQMSPDEDYLYLGIWNPSAREELKGSIYVLDMKTHKIIRQYRGIADKPMKIMYKDEKLY